MTVFRAGSFGVGWLLAMALVVSISPAAGQGYTPEQEQACTGDAFRLCSSEIPDIGRVTACMVAKKSQLSPACRAQFRPDPSEAAARPAGRPPDRDPAGNAAQGCERQAAQGQKAGETGDLTALRYSKIPSRGRLTPCLRHLQ
jgi:hypothetical protein